MLKEIDNEIFKRFCENVEKRKGQNDRAAIFGIIGEGGEVVDIIKKHLFHGHELDKNKLSEEIGDYIFYQIWWFNNIQFFKDFYDLIKLHLKRYEKEPFEDLLYELLLNFDISKAVYIIMNHYELDINEIMQKNVEKLEKRYPNGFNSADSINRKS